MCSEKMIELFVSIPKDVIREKIFPFFDALALVRLDTATLSREHRPSLLSHVLDDSILKGETTYSKDMVVWLAKRNIHVQHIAFPRQSTPEDIEIATPALSVADSIDITDCTLLTNECVQAMIVKSGSLEGIVLDGCGWLNDETLRVIAEQNFYLGKCHLSNCTQVTDAGVAHLLDKCMITELQLEGCEQAGPLTMGAMYDIPMDSLNIARCARIADADVVSFLQKNKDCLLEFVLSDNDQLTDLTLLAIAEHCPTLRELDISYCAGWTDKGLCAVIESCQKLLTFKLDGCDPSPVVLDRLCTRVNPELSTLCLDSCEALTQHHVEALVSRCTKLWDLKLGSSNGVNDRALQCMGENLSGLACITLDSCSNVRLTGIQALVRGCPKLEEIHLFMCPLVCDQCLIEIATHSKGLCWLSVTDNYNLSDKGVYALAQLCATLVRIKFDYTSISDAAIDHLIQCCPLITIVELQGRNVVSESLQRLVKQRGIHIFLEEDSHGDEEVMQDVLHDADLAGGGGGSGSEDESDASFFSEGEG